MKLFYALVNSSKFAAYMFIVKYEKRECQFISDAVFNQTNLTSCP